MRTFAARVWLHLRASPWLIPMAGMWFISDTNDWWVEQVGMNVAAAIVVTIGVVAGWLWYLGSPRPLAERLYPFVLLAGLVTLIVAFSDEPADVDVPGVYALAGIVGGLVLGERLALSWRRQRDTALSTPRSMAEFR